MTLKAQEEQRLQKLDFTKIKHFHAVAHKTAQQVKVLVV